MPAPRKWKSKTPVSQLDEAAAEHRRAQSRQAQRAFRQRKDDTIATLQSQVSALESTIERLSSCFLGLNDKLLEHLRSVEAENGEALAESIKDSMNEYKEIIQGEELDIAKNDSGGSGVLGSSQTTSSSNTGAPTQHELRHSSQSQRLTTQFSGPAFLGLTPTPTLAPHHSHEKISPASPTTQDHHALASRLYNSTVVKAFLILSGSDYSDPVFQRVFASYCSVFPPALAKQKVADMMQEKSTWSCFDKPLGSQRGWWSALQVAQFTCSQGWWFDRAQDTIILKKKNSQVVIGVEELLTEFLVDARCGIDDPEFRETTVVSALVRATM